MRTSLLLVPPAPAAPASRQVAAIADVLARRHGLSSAGVGSSCTLGLFFARHAENVTLSLCVTGSSDSISIRLSETSQRWSPKADSLRRALQDTLRVQFGSAAVK